MKLKEIRKLIKQISSEDAEEELLIKEISELYEPKEKDKLEKEISNLDSIKNELFKNISNLAPQIQQKMVKSYNEFLKREMEKDESRLD